MKIKVKDLRRLIRENYAREIPQFVIDDACAAAIKMKPQEASKHCRDKLEHYFKLHINSTPLSRTDMIGRIAKMHNVLANMEEEILGLKDLKDLKELVDRHVRFFLTN